MTKFLSSFILLLLPFLFLGQTTKVTGNVKDALTGESLPFVKVQFLNSKIGSITDSLGNYTIESYYATDSLQFIFFGYLTNTLEVKKDQEQEINCRLSIQITETEEVVIRPPDEFPSTKLHKRIIANKDINNKEKLKSFEYELYNKIQFDINNLSDKFTDRGILKKLDLIMNYLDSTKDGNSYLPVIISESISEYYFKNNPKRKKEIITASHITGIENIKLDQFVGDMYLDMNIYDNYINIFNKAFVSPIANFSRTFYKYYLEDSTFIDSRWCYKLRFTPKRTGDLTFEGEMWITDTTYAIKKISGNISPGANINYIKDLYFIHEFNLVAPEVWMLTKEEMIADINITENGKTFGLFGRKYSSRKNFKINEVYPTDFYKSDNTVEIHPQAGNRDEVYWKDHRHIPLSIQEKGIDEMVDSLNNLTVFKSLKNITFCLSTGYYPVNKLEIGSLNNLFSVNPIEQYRFGLAIRTSNKFSKKIEFGGKLAYGVGDERFKYGVTFRANLPSKKRSFLNAYYNYDIQQIGQSLNASTVGSTFGTLFRTGPLDKLTFVNKAGVNIEKDVKKDLVLFGGFEWKEYTALGLANYVKYNTKTFTNDTINKICSSEFTARIRWAKDEEYINATFDRTSITSRYPIFILQGTFGVKNLLGGNYNYQKIDFIMDHTRQVGVLGNISYGINAGYVFGSAAYPFLKIHEGNQSYWLMTTTFNKLNYFEFISDKYVGGYVEQHFGGLILNRIPGIKNLKWRLVGSARATYGSISSKSTREVALPTFTKTFGNIPYAEATAGIENIFKLIRIDLVWRLTHLDPGAKPLGIRARMTFNF